MLDRVALIPNPASIDAPCFNSINVLAFYRDYQRIYRRYNTSDIKAYLVINDYYTKDISPEVTFLTKNSDSTLRSLLIVIREKYAYSNKDFILITEATLKRFIIITKREPYSDLIQYSRHFTIIVQNITDTSGQIENTRKVKLFLQGLLEKDIITIVRKLRVNPLQLHSLNFNTILEAIQNIGSINIVVRIL